MSIATAYDNLELDAKDGAEPRRRYHGLTKQRGGAKADDSRPTQRQVAERCHEVFRRRLKGSGE